jgi:transcriptional regulator with XRE-family HTH domain
MELNEREIYFMKRRKLHITHQEIAEYLGVNQSSISRYERGEINFRLADDYKKYIDNKEKGNK